MYNAAVIFHGKNMVSPALNKMQQDALQTSFSMLTLHRNINKTLSRIPFFLGGRGAGLTLLTAGLYGMAAGIRKMSEEASRFSVANIQFTNLIGNAEIAADTLSKLRIFAAQTPFEFKYTQELSKGFLAAGVAVDDLVPTMRMLGDLGMGNVETIEQLSSAYLKTRIVGRATWRELKMFATAGVPIFDELKKILNTDQLGLERMSRQGRISFGFVEQALQNLTAEGGKFHGMMSTTMNTVPGMWSNFLEMLDKVYAQFMGLAEEPRKKFIASLVLMTNRLSELINANADKISAFFTKMFDAMTNFVVNFDVDKVVTGLAKVVAGAVAVVRAFKFFSIAMLLIRGVSTATEGLRSVWVISAGVMKWAMRTTGAEAMGFSVLWKAAMSVVTAGSISAGLATAAAFLPVFLVFAAILVVVGLIAWGLSKLVGFSITGQMDKMAASYADMFKEATGMDLPDSGGGILSNDAQRNLNSTEYIYKNSSSTANLNIRTSQGVSADLDRMVPGVKMFDSYGNQLAGSSNNA